jgi:DNA-binding beta-propeller fold protein YncE
VFDIERRRVIATLPMTTGPDGITMSRDGRRAYVAGTAGTVTVLDTANHQTIAQLPAPGSPQALVITPDGQHAYVADFASNTVTVIGTGAPPSPEPAPASGSVAAGRPQ